MDRQAVRDLWMKYANEQQETLRAAAENIEAHRKQFCRLQLRDQNGAPLAGQPVTIRQKTHDFQYGANIFALDGFETPEKNARYRELFKEYFNLATVPFYWNTLEPEPGKVRFAKDSVKIPRRPAPDLCMEYCEENGIAAKLHCLVYEGFTPEWVLADDMDAMEQLYDRRIHQIADRYNGRLCEVEVINEVCCESGWKESTVISGKRDVVNWAFALARRYMPNTPLLINEGNTLLNLAKEDYRDRYFMVVDLALRTGACIDKLGLQQHCFTGSRSDTPEGYEAEVMKGDAMFNPQLILRALGYAKELGLPMEITEVTIPTFGETEEDELLQADLLELFYTVCFSVPEVEGIIYWNVPDGYAYARPGWDQNRVRGGLFHSDLTPKKSGERLLELFGKRWHTELELVTDAHGFVEFRGFYGNYEAQLGTDIRTFGIHRGENVLNTLFI